MEIKAAEDLEYATQRAKEKDFPDDLDFSIEPAWYGRVKSALWPHVLGSLAVLVLIDYLTLVGWFVKLAAAAYLGIQLAAFPAGFILSAWGHFRGFTTVPGSVGRYTPLAVLGVRLFDQLKKDLLA